MRPILLSGHERSLTQVVYNQDGDLIFSTSKDHNASVWFSHNGERLGTLEGHNGTIWTIAPDVNSDFVVTGSADNQIRLWRVATGECLKVWELPTAIKRVQWSEDGNRFLAVTEKRMGHEGTIRVYEVSREGDGKTQADEPSLTITCSRSKAYLAGFCSLDRYIVSCHEDGSICQWDAKSGELYNRVADMHEAQVMDMQFSADRTYFITASRDKFAKLIDSDSLEVIKQYEATTPLNSAAILPGKPYVLLGGGQDAMNVTTTGARQGQFEIRFWHKVFEEELARVKGGFGPCNTIGVSPQGTGYAIGGEDGYVRVHHFDDDFFRQKPYGADMECED